MRTLKTLALAILLSVTTATAVAQDKPEYKIVGNEIVKVGAEKKKSEPIKTDLIHKVGETTYPVFQSARGAYFIIRTSKKTGKEYKQYLKITGSVE